MTSYKLQHLTFALFLVLLPVVSLVGSKAVAQSSECIVDQNNNTVCPPARSICIKETNNSTIKCSPPDGGITADRYGAAQCGVGRCVADIRGDVFCAKASGGSAARGQYGDAVCTGGCAPAQASLCNTLSR